MNSLLALVNRSVERTGQTAEDVLCSGGAGTAQPDGGLRHRRDLTAGGGPDGAAAVRPTRKPLTPKSTA